MKKSTAYTITKMIQSFLATALEIKTKYIDTGSYSKTKELLDFGTDEKPSVWALAFRMTDMCRENDASYHMGTPVLDEDTLSAYADHIIDNGDIIASGKITKEKISVLEDVIEFFQAEYPKLYDDSTDNVPEITTVCNTLKYIKEWESEYCQSIEKTISDKEHSAQLISEDEVVSQRRAVPVSQAEVHSIMRSLTKFSYEFSKVRDFKIEQTLILERIGEDVTGVPFSSVDLYNKQQTSSFYDKAYSYSKSNKSVFAYFGRGSKYDGFPIKSEKKYPDDNEDLILHFYFEAFICKWATLHVDLLRLYDYAEATEDIDIIRDMKELLDESNASYFPFMYRRDKRWDENYDESIYKSLRAFTDKISNVESLAERYLMQHVEGLVGEDEIRSRKFMKAFFEPILPPTAEGNKSTWTKKTVERFMNLSIGDFVFVLRDQFEAIKQPTLKKFSLPSFDDIYGYLEAKTASFNKDRMIIILAQLEAANEALTEELQEQAVKDHVLWDDGIDEETGEHNIKYDDETPMDENGKPDPQKCYEKLYGNKHYPDTYRYDYAVGILYEKLGYQEDASQEPFEVDGIKIHKYIKSAPGKVKIVVAEPEEPTESTTPIDKVFKKTVQYHKRVAIYDHLIENKGIRSAHNYIGAIAIAMKDHKMVDYKYQDFSALSLALGKAVGFDENRMNIRATKIGQKHKETADAFIDTVSKSREPRKQEE